MSWKVSELVGYPAIQGLHRSINTAVEASFYGNWDKLWLCGILRSVWHGSNILTFVIKRLFTFCFSEMSDKVLLYEEIEYGGKEVVRY